MSTSEVPEKGYRKSKEQILICSNSTCVYIYIYIRLGHCQDRKANQDDA